MQSIFPVVCWSVWLERNKRFFIFFLMILRSLYWSAGEDFKLVVASWVKSIRSLSISLYQSWLKIGVQLIVDLGLKSISCLLNIITFDCQINNKYYTFASNKKREKNYCYAQFTFNVVMRLNFLLSLDFTFLGFTLWSIYDFKVLLDVLRFLRW